MDQENNQNVDTKNVSNESVSNENVSNPENKKSTTSKAVKGCGIGCAGVIALIVLGGIIGSVDNNSSSSSTGSSSSSSQSSSSKRDPQIANAIEKAVMKDLLSGGSSIVYFVRIDETEFREFTDRENRYVYFRGECETAAIRDGIELPGTRRRRPISGTYDTSWGILCGDAQLY